MNEHKIKYTNNSTHPETGDDISLLMYITPGNELKILHELERILCQAKETLNQLAHKQKTWEAKVENQVVQPEQESSTPNNDQKSQEKVQSQRTVKTNKKQYLVSYGSGIDTEAVENLMEQVEKDNSVYFPDTVTIQVIDL